MTRKEIRISDRKRKLCFLLFHINLNKCLNIIVSFIYALSALTTFNFDILQAGYTPEIKPKNTQAIKL